MNEQLAKRLLELDANVKRNIDAINDRMEPHLPRLNRRLTELLHSKRSKIDRLYGLWALADDSNTFNGENVACRRGCSACCHIAVAMLPEEAHAVGKRIGRQPRKVKLRSSFDDFDYGYHNPCVFLKDNLCSIYEHRPLACRIHYSLDVDSLMCEFDHKVERSVPMFDRANFLMAALNIADPPQMNCLADIREYFPK